VKWIVKGEYVDMAELLKDNLELVNERRALYGISLADPGSKAGSSGHPGLVTVL
jgi:hypothetical protein